MYQVSGMRLKTKSQDVYIKYITVRMNIIRHHEDTTEVIDKIQRIKK